MESAKTIWGFSHAGDRFNYTSEESDRHLKKSPAKWLPGEVTITSEELLEKLCQCDVCTENPRHGKDTMIGRRDERCKIYRERLFAAYPIGEPVSTPVGEVYPVMGGFVSKKLLDDYSNAIADRLRSLNKKPIGNDYSRPIYQIDELEEQRRGLHLAILGNAGFMAFEVGHCATAFKMVIEHFIEERMKRLGLIS
jgi:hypothetical protein